MPDTMIPALKCERCEHIWVPRKEHRPITCPGCNSPYWDRPRQHHKAFVKVSDISTTPATVKAPKINWGDFTSD